MIPRCQKHGYRCEPMEEPEEERDGVGSDQVMLEEIAAAEQRVSSLFLSEPGDRIERPSLSVPTRSCDVGSGAEPGKGRV